MHKLKHRMFFAEYNYTAPSIVTIAAIRDEWPFVKANLKLRTKQSPNVRDELALQPPFG